MTLPGKYMAKIWKMTMCGSGVVMLLLLPACTTTVTEPQQQIVEKHPLDGIWQGSFDIRGRGPYDFHAIHVDGRSTAVSLQAKAICVGSVSLDGIHYLAKYNLFALDGAPFDYATITGELNDATIASHFVTLNGGDTGSLTIAYNEIYEQDSSLEQLKGKWSFTDRDGLVLDIIIDKQGNAQGQDSDQCEYAGTINLINSDYNAFDVALSISNCGSVNGQYKGLAYLESSDAEYFRVDVLNEFYGFHYDLQKQIN